MTSTPNAPVEQREAIDRAIGIFLDDTDWLRSGLGIEDKRRRMADAILAVRLDEAAIRKDEREKCAAWHDVQADALEAMIDAIVKDGGWVDRSRKERVEFHRKCAQAIRNGGKQP